MCDQEATAGNDLQPGLQGRSCGTTRSSAARYLSVDIVRGIIMILMALDHASAWWDSGRSHPLEAALPPLSPTVYENVAQQITREVTHICAPGFQLLAGMGLAISVCRRRGGGQRQWRISADMILRAAVLFACEWILLYFPMGQVGFLFAVLCCIGSAMAIFAVARFLPLPIILFASVAVLLTASFYAPDAVNTAPSAAGYPTTVWTGVALGGPIPRWWVLYPILPWVGFFGIGWWLGASLERRSWYRARGLLLVGVALFVAGMALRWIGGAYGDRMPGGVEGPLSSSFWALAKYPPSPAFSLMTLGGLLMLLGLFRRVDDAERPLAAWELPAVFGRVALFFFVVHLYLYGAVPTTTNTVSQYSLTATYLVWLAGLALLWPLCLLYARLRVRHRGVLRYF